MLKTQVNSKVSDKHSIMLSENKQNVWNEASVQCTMTVFC